MCILLFGVNINKILCVVSQNCERQQGGIFMKIQQRKGMSTEKMVTSALLTAIVIVLQFVSMNIRTGIFSITLSLIPIAVGAILYGYSIGAWLGFVLGLTVLLTGDAAPFMTTPTTSIFAIIIVLLKTTTCGAVAGLTFSALKNTNKTFASAISALLCPIINTGIFIIGCWLFFIPEVGSLYGNWSAFYYIILGFNFPIELVLNIVLIPVIVRLIKIKLKD